jgi:hypothetical protein
LTWWQDHKAGRRVYSEIGNELNPVKNR